MEAWFYHSWFYTYVINTLWFAYFVAGTVIGVNLFGWLIVWRTFAGPQNDDKNPTGKS